MRKVYFEYFCFTIFYGVYCIKDFDIYIFKIVFLFTCPICLTDESLLISCFYHFHSPSISFIHDLVSCTRCKCSFIHSFFGRFRFARMCDCISIGHVPEFFLKFVVALLQIRVIIIDESTQRIGESEVTTGFLQTRQKVHNNFI